MGIHIRLWPQDFLHVALAFTLFAALLRFTYLRPFMTSLSTSESSVLTSFPELKQGGVVDMQK